MLLSLSQFQISTDDYIKAAEWTGSITGVMAALLLALKLEGSGYAYALFLVSNLSLIPFFIYKQDYALLGKEIIFVVINVLGIMMWLV